MQVEKAFNQRSSFAQHVLETHLKDFPYTPYLDEVYTMQGILLTEEEKFEQAIDFFQRVKVKQISRQLTPLYYFHIGYAYFQLGNNEQALIYLQQLKNKNNPYSIQATYYIGCSYYNQKEYSKALVEFLSLEQIGGYQQIAPYYVVQIYYATSQYNNVLERAEKLPGTLSKN